MKIEISGMVWLPLNELSYNQINNLKRDLTIYPKKTTDIVAKEDPEPIFMFKETDTHLGIPRAWYSRNMSKNHEEIVRVSHGRPMKDLKTRYRSDGHFVEQEAVMKMFFAQMENREWGGFLLKAGCGFGKTATALEIARRNGRSTLVLVHQEFLLNQWIDRIQYFMPGSRIGIIRQNKCEYENVDFAIGMMQSLCRNTEKYPQEMFDAFGLVISDECHRVAAPTWSEVIGLFNSAYRLGLSATPKRKDGTQGVFFNHISDISYSATSESMVPKLRMVKTSSRLEMIKRGKYEVAADKLNSAQVINQLCKDNFRNKDIVDQIVEAVKNSRKVLVISERIEHIKKLSDMTGDALFNLKLPFAPIIDFYTGEWFSGEVWDRSTKTHRKGEPKMVKRTREDLKKAESANVLFATKQMCEEGFDIEALDVLVLTIPMSDPEQVVGRIRRWCVPETNKCKRLCSWRAGICKEKTNTIVVDIIDEHEDKLVSKFRRRMQFYKSIKMV